MSSVFYETGISAQLKVSCITTWVYCGKAAGRGVGDHLFVEVNRRLWHERIRKPMARNDGLKVHPKDLHAILKTWRAARKWVAGVQERRGKFRDGEVLGG